MLSLNGGTVHPSRVDPECVPRSLTRVCTCMLCIRIAIRSVPARASAPEAPSFRPRPGLRLGRRRGRSGPALPTLLAGRDAGAPPSLLLVHVSSRVSSAPAQEAGLAGLSPCIRFRRGHRGRCELSGWGDGAAGSGECAHVGGGRRAPLGRRALARAPTPLSGPLCRAEVDVGVQGGPESALSPHVPFGMRQCRQNE